MIQRNSKANHSGASSEEQNDEYSYEWHSKFSPKDLLPFCEQLGKFVKYIRNVQELTSLTYGYPSLLQERLEADANELQSLYMEGKAAVAEIERIKQQRKCIRKEINIAKKALKKLHEDEQHEMEAVISTYDKNMYTRWESLKNTSKPQMLQVFLNDIKGKQEALDHLNTLVTRKLQQITPLSMPWGALNNVQLNKDATDSTEEKKMLSTRNSHNRYHQGGSSIPRWSAFGRNNTTQFGRTVAFAQQQETNSHLPLVPFTINNSPFQFPNRDLNESLNSNNETSSINIFRDSSSITVNSSDSSSSNSSNFNIPANVATTNEFQNDMGSVLQALFGQLRQNAPTTIPTTDAEAETNNSNDISNEGIELFRQTN